MGKHSRDRSPRHKSKKDDRDRKDRRDKDRRDSDRRHDKNSHSSKTQKEIEALKSRRKELLNSAVSDIKRLEQSEFASGESSRPARDDEPLTVSETLQRNVDIERIEQGGFTPAAFISGRGMKKTNAEQKLDAATKDHESAVFGPMWKSKELTKKLAKQEVAKPPTQQPSVASIPLPSNPALNTDFDDFPLAKKWLNSNQDERRERWKQTFHEQRRKLFEGTL